jgi:hypothetical protein
LVALGHKVAVVVDCKPKDPHPTVPGFTNATVNGDEHDLIFLADAEGRRGCFITLAFKAGKGRAAALAHSIADDFTARVEPRTNTVITDYP